MTGQGLDHYQKLDVDKQDNDDALRVVYDEWANKYDHDNDATWVQYPSQRPLKFSSVLEKHAKILDAGCGTGLSGQNWQNKDMMRLTVSIYRRNAATRKNTRVRKAFSIQSE